MGANVKFYKACILFNHEISYLSPIKFEVDVNTEDGQKIYKALEHGGCTNSNKIYGISDYDTDDNVTQLAFFCSDYDSILNFCDGLLIGKSISELNRTVEFSRN